ncbi:hypothetical protein JCM5353_000073 [Sporobolomyces roseus]
MAPISQSITAKYLKQAQTDAEVEEVLGAYLHSKQAKATNPSQVLRKLALLKLYLNAIGQHDQVQRHPQPFRTISSLAARGVPAANLVFPSTPLGSEIWHEATKVSKSWFSRSLSSGGTLSSASSMSGYDLDY